MLVASFASETFGGAGVAAARVHQGLLQQGIDSRLFYDKGELTESNALRKQVATNYWLRLKNDLTWGLTHRRNKPGFDIFTSPYGVRKTPLSFFGCSPDIVNLHWIARWLDMPSFFKTLPRSMPVVWSLHDMNAFTGGCHLWTGCDSFTTHCQRCPQLRSLGGKDVASHYFDEKERAYHGKDLYVIGNSEWMTNQARRSHLLRNAISFETIHLGLNTEEYAPLDKTTARAALRLPSANYVVGFACADVSSINKNLTGLFDALMQLPDKEKVLLVVLGGGKAPDIPTDLRTIFLGALNSPRMQSIFYSALDVFVLPSRLESFGQTGLEAMACGTPVIAFRTGGLPDFVDDGVTGLLAPDPNNPAGLAERLLWLQHHEQERRAMSEAARKTVEHRFTIKLMAERYNRFYQTILERKYLKGESGK